jgi:hypothetical protein
MIGDRAVTFSSGVMNAKAPLVELARVIGYRALKITTR